MSLKSPLSTLLQNWHPRVLAVGALLIVSAIITLLAVCGTDAVWVPKCMFHQLTGLDCPGCGSQRAIVAATHGRWADAWHLNPALWVGLTIAFIYTMFPYRQPPRRRVERILYSPTAYLSIAAAIVIWTIARNL